MAPPQSTSVLAELEARRDTAAPACLPLQSEHRKGGRAGRGGKGVGGRHKPRLPGRGLRARQQQHRVRMHMRCGHLCVTGHRQFVIKHFNVKATSGFSSSSSRLARDGHNIAALGFTTSRRRLHVPSTLPPQGCGLPFSPGSVQRASCASKNSPRRPFMYTY
ncbi:hypothetical protein NDU88_009993 [Pleurodeles waltl]|uniref:Uncharacterized protein n=1 Tax=Pleurodeles waltl TaxID=8319 RepID=A0AAV7S2M1_PLEWA|nr:hypothetical protein NDU88_009993 [Pleurodeles waltl]